MLIRILAFALIVFCFLSRPVAAVGDEGWIEDIVLALDKAKKENKLLLLEFTGSDWCPPCIKLNDEVFSKPEFIKTAAENFVLVKLDFPRQKEVPENIAAQNKKWSEWFSVENFPTVILMDSEEQPFGFIGYIEGGVTPYLENLAGLRAAKLRFDDAMKEANANQGLERAKALDRALSELDEDIVNVYYDKLVKEIVKTDANDEAGLRTKWFAAQDAETRKILWLDIVTISRLEEPEQAIALIDEAVAKIKLPTQMQLDVLKLKLGLLVKSKKIDEAESLIDSMIEMDGVGVETRQKLIVKKTFMLVGFDRRDEAIDYLEKKIAGLAENVYLHVARGELHHNAGEFEQAIKSYDTAMPSAVTNPDLMIEIFGSKADSLVALKKENEALDLLDKFATDANWPADLRSEAYLQKAMIFREQGRTGPALRAEASAVKISETARDKAHLEKMTEQLRAKYKKN